MSLPLWPSGKFGLAMQQAQTHLTRLLDRDEVPESEIALHTTQAAVVVTTDDIAEGDARQYRGEYHQLYRCHSCPVKRAIQRQLLPGWVVTVGRRTALFYRLDNPAHQWRVRLPQNAANFVYWFDDPAQGVLFRARSFTFHLPIPTEALLPPEAC